MPGIRSITGFCSATDRAVMGEDHPVSALQTLVIRNNTQHLIDQAVQYRVNWCASTSTSEYGAGSEGASRDLGQYAWVFPTTITDEGTLPSYDLRVATRLTGTLASGTVQATLMDIPKALNNAPIYTTNFSNPTMSSTATWYDDTFEVDKPWSTRSSRIAFIENIGAGPNLSATPRSFVLLMLQINCIPGSSGTGNVQLCGVQLREWLSQ